MKSTLIFTMVLSVIIAVQSQTWAGTYTADGSCDTSSCCCLAGKVVVASIGSSSAYSVTSNVNGVCGVATTFSGIGYTSGYTGWMFVAGDNDTLALSSDSQTITVTNSVHPLCSGKGVKSAAMKQYSNIIILYILMFIGGWINKSQI